MDGIKWTNHKFGTKKSPWYKAKIGDIELWCRQVTIVCATKNRRGIKGWDGTIHIGDKWLASTKTRKLLESAKKDAERIATKYLFGGGLIMLKGFKEMGLLEEALSQVGVDL